MAALQRTRRGVRTVSRWAGPALCLAIITAALATRNVTREAHVRRTYVAFGDGHLAASWLHPKAFTFLATTWTFDRSTASAPIAALGLDRVPAFNRTPRGSWRLCVPVWTLLVAGVTLTVLAWFLPRRRAPGLCSRCGYALVGLDPHAPCPECGRARPARVQRPLSPRPPPRCHNPATMAQPAPASTLEQLSESYARHLDATDPLPTLRDQFHIPPSPADPREESVYLCGNSLGLQPKATRAALLQELDDWARLGVEGHVHAKHPWLPYHEELRDTAARLVGARPGEVVAMNSLTANLHLMMVSFYRPTAARHRIVIEDSAFPSDSYAVTSQAAFHGFDPRTAVVRLKPRDGEQTLRTDDVESLLEREGKSVALMLLGGVNYLTGQVMDMPRLTAAAHRAGAVAGWDLAHAAGNIAVQLHDWDADFACWCTYKYLNSGPGAVAGCFVHERHGRKTAAYDRMDSPDFLPRFAGWWGNDPATRFKMGPEFTPRDTADAWQLSNPPILALAPYRVSLEIFDKVGIRNLRAKSDRLTAYLQALIDAIPGAERTVEVITPREPGARGAQLSIAVKDRPRDLFKALTADGVLCDFREPNVVRVAPAPLYNTFHDCWRFAQILRTHLARH